MKGKRYAVLSGVLVLPLRIGCRTIIRHDKGYTHTSKVVAIHSVQSGNIRFETADSHYCLLPIPASQPVDCRPALSMAA